jgi:hypothetical protein
MVTPVALCGLDVGEPDVEAVAVNVVFLAMLFTRP